MTDTISPFRDFAPGTQPAYDVPAYGSTGLRHPTQPTLKIPQTVTELTGPRFDPVRFPVCADMSIREGHAALGERIILRGRVLDEDARPVRKTMVEVWQANAAGRYDHAGDIHDAPLDTNFHGAATVYTDDDGWYEFTTIKPGAYPWRNHANAWRPAHIHFSLFGPGFATRLVTQMYFPGDPLLALDPIFNGLPDRGARDGLVARFDLDVTRPDWALGYRWDIFLRGRAATVMEGGA